jgi:hypothetical protein
VLKSNPQVPASKSVALRKVVSSIVCHFEPKLVGSQPQMRLARVQFVPHLGAPVTLPDPVPDGPDGGPGVGSVGTHHQNEMGRHHVAVVRILEGISVTFKA